MNTQELFDTLKGLADQAKVDPTLEALIMVELTEPDPDIWHGRIKDGQLDLVQGQPENPDFTVTASSETALKLFDKTMNPMTAFMMGKVKVRGDLAKANVLKQLLMGGKKTK